jgi:hypothetical protein
LNNSWTMENEKGLKRTTNKCSKIKKINFANFVTDKLLNEKWRK